MKAIFPIFSKVFAIFCWFLLYFPRFFHPGDPVNPDIFLINPFLAGPPRGDGAPLGGGADAADADGGSGSGVSTRTPPAAAGGTRAVGAMTPRAICPGGSPQKRE